MGAATQAHRLDAALEIVAFEKSDWTSYSACGIPYVVGGSVDGLDQLVVRTPQEHRDRSLIDVRIRHEVMGIDLDSRRLEVRDHAHSRTIQVPFDELMLGMGARAGAARPARNRSPGGPWGADPRRRRPPPASRRVEGVPQRRRGRRRLHRSRAGGGVRRARRAGGRRRGRTARARDTRRRHGGAGRRRDAAPRHRCSRRAARHRIRRSHRADRRRPDPRGSDRARPRRRAEHRTARGDGCRSRSARRR